jgi:hypothetical protein
MNDGPTTAGSIVGKLIIDKSDWDRKLIEAKAQADKLGSSDPTIRVDAKVDEALAKLEAVRAAQEKLGFASDRLRIAYQRLDEVQTRGGASQSRLMSLHLAAARAEAAHEAATRGLAAAQAGLGDSTTHTTETIDRQNAANGRGVQRWQLIAGVIAGLLPLVAPLGAYLVGAAGALAGMGAAGVLAIYGVVQATKQATVEGRQWSAGLQTLKGDLDQLAGTAASGLLSSFGRAVQTINAAMPQLNSEIGTFAGILGTAGNQVLTGVINALRILNPLFVASAQYVADLADGFLRWTQDGGLEKFATYAQQELPRVEQTLASLAALIMHIVEALAPLGGPALTIIGGLADAINAIPTEALTALVVAGGTAFVAIKAWAALVPIINGVSTALGGAKLASAGLVGGIVGASLALDTLILSGTRAAVSSFQLFTGTTKDVNAWSQAIKGGNVNVNNLGHTLEATGGFWSDFAHNVDVTGTGISTFYDNAKNLDTALAQADPKDLVKGYQNLVAEGKKVGKTTQDIADVFPAATAAYRANKGAVDQANASQSESARILGLDQAAYERLTGRMSDATNEAKLWKDALDLINGTAQTLEQTNIALAQDFQTSAQSIAANITAVGKAQATSLDINSQYGVQNHQMILQAVQDAEARAVAVVAADEKAGKSSSQAVADGNANLAASKQSIVDHMVAAGLDRAAVQGIVDTLISVPKSVTTTVIANTSQAQAAIDALLGSYAAMARQGTVVAGRGAGAAHGKAHGGTIGLAAGGTTGFTVNGPGTSMSDQAGLYALANGEEVISNMSGQANQWRSALKLMNSGAPKLQVAQMVNQIAGSSGGSTTTNSRVTTNNWNISGPDPDAVAARVHYKQWTAGLA